MEKRTGGCHCGKVRYEADVDLSKPVVECNCSICAGKGLLLTFTTAEHMVITSGEEFLTEYRFNKEKIAHLFCKVCGSEVFGRGNDAQGQPTYAVNVRTLDDINLEALNKTPFDGKSI